jgi:hypothetical protein
VAAFSDAAFSIAGFSEAAFDFGTVAAVDTPTGGFFLGFDHALAKSQRRKKELEDLAAAQQSIEDEQAREIAELLRAQEEKDAERDDMARLQALADTYARKGTQVPRPMLAAVMKASEERTTSSLQQMRRQAERMMEEEEMAMILTMMLDD